MPASERYVVRPLHLYTKCWSNNWIKFSGGQQFLRVSRKSYDFCESHIFRRLYEAANKTKFYLEVSNLRRWKELESLSCLIDFQIPLASRAKSHDFFGITSKWRFTFSKRSIRKRCSDSRTRSGTWIAIGFSWIKLSIYLTYALLAFDRLSKKKTVQYPIVSLVPFHRVSRDSLLLPECCSALSHPLTPQDVYLHINVYLWMWLSFENQNSRKRSGRFNNSRSFT